MDEGGELANDARRLLDKSDRLRVDFLETDLDLGFTFCETARIEASIDPPAVARLVENIRGVIETVEQFAPLVQGDAARQRIRARAEKLRDELSTLVEIQTKTNTPTQP